MGESKRVIKLPRSTDDLRIRDLAALKLLKEDPTPQNKVEFVSTMAGVPVEEFATVPMCDINAMYDHCLRLWSNYKEGKPPKVVMINGKSYKLVDPHKVGVSWHIDVGNPNEPLDGNPSRQAALMYIEKSATYGAVDENKNIINPIAGRKDIFEQHMPLSIYMDANAFFLQKYDRLMPAFTALQTARMIEVERRKAELSNPSKEDSTGKNVFTRWRSFTKWIVGTSFRSTFISLLTWPISWFTRRKKTWRTQG